MLSYVFQSGSYWFYENELTLVTDSVVLDSTVHYITWSPQAGTPGHLIIDSTEYYRMNLRHATNDLTFTYYITQSYIYQNTPGYGQWIFSLPSPYYQDPNIDTLPVLSVLGNNFYDVIKVKVKTYPTQYHAENYPVNTFLYYSPNYGLIRKEIADTINGTQIWNLKRWNIVQ